MTNAENINKVIEAIRNEENFFSMAAFAVADPQKNLTDRSNGSYCGTPACIAGWASYISADKKLPAYAGEDDFNVEWTELNAEKLACSNLIQSSAREFLGISDRDADFLFLGEDDGGAVDLLLNITRQEAIKTLEILRDTGKVDYSHCENYIGSKQSDD